MGIVPCGGGCSGDSGANRVPVSGTVTHDGIPLSGSITLLPEPSVDGPAASASIVQGKFRFSALDGPFPGAHQAIITGSQELTDEDKSAPPKWQFAIEVDSVDPVLPDLELTTP